MATNNDWKPQAADILVVDDTIASLRLLTEILSRAGYRVRPADGPKLALQSALAHPPSLILLDVRMPGMSGFEVCRRLKQDERTRNIPIIFVSALQDVDDRVQGFEVGGVDFVSKPFEEAEVLARVNTHLQLHGLNLHLENLVAGRTAELTQTNEALQTEIVQRKQVEQTLRESEERFRATFEQAAVGIAHVALGGRFLRINQKFCDIVGYSHDEMLAQTFQDITHPADLDADLEHVRRLLAGETDSYSMEKRYLHRNGAIVWINLTVSLIWERTGEARHFVSVVEDITERKRVEEQYRAFFTENVSPVFWTEMKNPIPVDLPPEEQVDAIFREAYVKDISDSTARMYGTTREELLGEMVAPWSFEGYQDRDSALHQHYQRFVQSGYVSHAAEVHERTQDGRGVWLLMSIKGIVEDGHLVRVWGSQVDITQRKQAEQALRDSEENYRTLVEQAQDGIVILQDGKIRFLNAYLAALSGRTVEEMLDTPFESYLPADQAEKVVDRYQRRMKRKAVPSVYESAIEHKDGSEVGVEFNAGLTSHNGRPADLVLVRDIRERLQAQRELQASRRLLSLVIDNVPAQVAYVDKGQTFRFVNRRYEEIYGLPRSEFVGSHVREILGPEGYAATEPYLAAALAGDAVRYEAAFHDRDGGARWLRVNYAPDKGKAGDVQGVVGTIIDITERRRAEETLRRSHERLEEAQRTAQIGDWEYDILAGRITWSAEMYRIFDLDPERYVPSAKSDEEFCHPEDAPVLRKAFNRFFASGEPLDLDYRIVTPQGTVKACRRRGRLILDEQGTPILAIGTTEDITERKRVEERVLEYQRRLRFLASQLTLIEERERRRIARELHDEVGQRLAFARMGLASARDIDSESQREAILEDVSQSVRRAIGDIRDLVFDLSSPLMDEIGLAAALAEWLEEQVARKHGLRTEFINDGQRLPLDDDMRAMLYRSTRELLTNVVKHAQATRVKVRLEGEGSRVRIVVEDDGIGFDAGARPRVMEREGGFGLFSIQERMADLGGSLEIRSEPGQGCVATLTSPATIE